MPPFTRLQDRITVFVVMLLLGAQLVSFFIVRYAIESTSTGAMREELAADANVWSYLVAHEPQGAGDSHPGAMRDLKRLTGSDVTVVRREGGVPRVVATTLPTLSRAALEARLPTLMEDPRSVGGSRATLGETSYAFLVRPFDGASLAVLQRSTNEVRTAGLLLETALLVISGLALAATLVGGILIARRITRPVSRLGDAVREIERGNFAVRMASSDADEIGELARAFDRMAQGLSERDRVRGLLDKMASNEVVEQLLDGRIALEGEEREVTVMFVDIRNFTGLVERLAPQQSLQMLNAFLTVVTDTIQVHGGVVDKYLGDGAMALFGAPVTRADDASRAVACALAIRDEVGELGPALDAKGLPRPQLAIGLNTSRVIAGNIGSPTRLNYTVLGDGVNVASRLEGLTRRYDVEIVVGETTREQVRHVAYRELEKVRVRGRVGALRIFEPLAREGGLTPREMVILAQWHEALEMFRLRCWDAAEAGMRAIAGEPGYARLTELYLAYIPELRAAPPGPDWDAAHAAEAK
ncbi:MAG TPA: adenylate/guanylate cyclase domain-containing protein [Usitatibacter sp.]|jgi:adenylate cyclase|nr:adenylate/guanylate cyclase domain-containing protein [Usitatibacter sp.]